jgi:LysM repeat protein
MSLSSALERVLMLALLAVGVSGCFPLADGPADEEKDPHFLAGKSRLSGMDFDGAINAFENALVANPKSAAAHFELGYLYEEKKSDYAAAIYHFQRHLELRPDSSMAETVKQHILACKLELAKTVPFALVNRQVQDELRKLYASNAALHELVEQLKQKNVDTELAWSNRLATVLAAQAAAQVPVATQAAVDHEPERRVPVPEKVNSSGGLHSSSRLTSVPKTHIVKSGETLASVARRYNVKLTALESANPGIDPRKLKAGQTLYIPAPKN